MHRSNASSVACLAERLAPKSSPTRLLSRQLENTTGVTNSDNFHHPCSSWFRICYVHCSARKTHHTFHGRSRRSTRPATFSPTRRSRARLVVSAATATASIAAAAAAAASTGRHRTSLTRCGVAVRACNAGAARRRRAGQLRAQSDKARHGCSLSVRQAGRSPRNGRLGPPVSQEIAPRGEPLLD